MAQQHYFITRAPDLKLDGENIYRKKGGLDAAEVLTRYQLQDRAVVEK